MRGLLPPRRVRVSCAGGSVLKLADRHQIHERSRGASAKSYEILLPPTGIPESITSDGGPEFASHTTRDFLSSWCVHHRTSSAYNPHANCWAETAVKTTKRMIAGNTGPGGTLSDDFHLALLQYRKRTKLRTTGMSPAQCLFGRATRDLLPGLPDTYRPHQELDIETGPP